MKISYLSLYAFLVIMSFLLVISSCKEDPVVVTGNVEGTVQNETEPNGNTIQAQIIYLNGTISGSIGYSGDNVDYYAFIPQAHGSFSFAIARTSTSNGCIGSCNLYQDENNKMLTTTGIIYDYSNRPRNSDTVPVGKGVKYLIKIPQYNNSNDACTYELTTFFTPVAQLDVGEPNNNISAATPITLNAPVTALIGYAGDNVDYYTFTPSMDGTFSFIVERLITPLTAGTDIGNCSLYQYGSSKSITSTGVIHYYSESRDSKTVNLNEGTQYIIKIPQYEFGDASPYKLITNFH